MIYMRFLFVLMLNLPVVVLAGDKAGWPCFHGPRRDNLSAETGLLKVWPDEEAKLGTATYYFLDINC